MSQLYSKSVLGKARLWHQVDLQNRTLGKVASRIAVVLMGKHKPIFDRGTDCGDYVVVTNCEKVFLSGKKTQQKYYFKPSTFIGNSRHIPFREVMERRPEDVIAHAVSRMLPKNRLRQGRLARLKVFQGTEHPYGPNLVKRYDLSPTGKWDGQDQAPARQTDSTAWEFARRKEQPLSVGRGKDA